MPASISKFMSEFSKRLKSIFLPSDQTRTERNIRRVRNFVFLALISTGLWAITRYTWLEGSIQAPSIYLRPFWLVLIFWSLLLAYHSTRHLFYLIRTEPVQELFPEIKSTWNYAKTVMEEAGVPPSSLPIILVLGSRPNQGPHFFDQAQIRLRNIKPPGIQDPPFHIDLTDSAIFVTCPSTSLTGTFSKRLEQSLSPFILAQSLYSMESQISKTKSLIGLTPDGTQENGDSNSSPQLQNDPFKKFEQQPTPSNQNEMELISFKLRTLCDLIVADRRPFAPINGVIFVLPTDVTSSDRLTSHAIEMTTIDMDSIRESTGLNFPFAILGSHLERIQGFSELALKLDPKSKWRYLGLALQTRLDVKTEAWTKNFRRGLRWYRKNVLPALIYNKMLTLKPADSATQGSPRKSMIEANHSAYQFLEKTSESFRRFEKICLGLTDLQIKELKSNPRFAGLFFTAMENPDTGPWLFIQDMLKHFLNQQNSISWTEDAIRIDRFRRRLSLIILVSMAVSIALTILFYFTMIK